MVCVQYFFSMGKPQVTIAYWGHSGAFILQDSCHDSAMREQTSGHIHFFCEHAGEPYPSQDDVMVIPDAMRRL